MSDQAQEEKKKGTARPIAFPKAQSPYATAGGGAKHLDIQQSEHSDTQTSNSPDLETAKGSGVKKSKHPEWKQKTIYLPPAIAKRLKVHAVEAELEISEIVALALQEYLDRHPGRS